MPAGAEMEVARANRAVPPRIILDLSSICYTDRLGAGFGHGGANPNAKEKGLCTSAYHHHYIDPVIERLKQIQGQSPYFEF